MPVLPSAVPKRATNCEAALVGQPWNLETVKTAMAALSDDFEPLSDFRASKEYRALTAANMLHRFYLEQQSNGQIETRVTAYV